MVNVAQLELVPVEAAHVGRGDFGVLRGIPIKGVSFRPSGGVQRVQRGVGGNLAGGKIRPVRARVCVDHSIKFLSRVGACDAQEPVKHTEVAADVELERRRPVRGHQLGHGKGVSIGIPDVRGDTGGVSDGRQFVLGRGGSLGPGFSVSQ